MKGALAFIPEDATAKDGLEMGFELGQKAVMDEVLEHLAEQAAMAAKEGKQHKFNFLTRLAKEICGIKIAMKMVDEGTMPHKGQMN